MTLAPTAWFVCFWRDDRRHWWDWVLAPGFRHCALVGHQDSRGWVYINWHMGMLTCEPIEAKDVDWLWTRCFADGGAVLRMPIGSGGEDRPWFVWSCVGACAAVLGVGGDCWTPNGLYRRLVRLAGCRSLDA